MIQRGCDKASKERVRIKRFGFEFGVELNPYKPWVIGTFDNFRQQTIGRHTGKHQAMLFERFDIRAVHLIAVTVAL